MIISIIGSHGTGKTTLGNSLIAKLGNEWSVFDDYYRKTAQQLSYKTPQDAVLENQAISQISSTAMAGAAFGAMFEWLESIEGHGIIDTGPPSILAYHRYWLKVCDTPISPYMLRLAKTISQKIDAFCYLPMGKITLENDGIRSTDTIFQKDIDQWVLCNNTDLEVHESKVLMVESTEIDERTEECIKMISSLLRNQEISS